MKFKKKRLTLFKILAVLILIDLVLDVTVTTVTVNINLPPRDKHSVIPFSRPQEKQLKSSSNGNDAAEVAVSAAYNADNNDDLASFSILTRAVFYNVYLNPTTGTTFRKSLKIVEEQLGYLAKSVDGMGNYTKVFYNIIGQRYRQNICNAFPTLDCKMMRYYKEGSEALTLQALHRYCVAHPRHRVTYLHDKGSFRQSSNNIFSRRRGTQGAVSVQCLQMPLSSDYQCNVCGAKFQALPHPNYQANMWTAECDYIRQLVPPEEYVGKREKLMESLYQEYDCLNVDPDSTMAVTSWSWNLTDPLFLRNVGLGRYALERWVLNHPGMIPCEIWSDVIVRLWDDSNLSLGEPSEFGKMVSKKVKARQSWFLRQEYDAFYPGVPVNPLLAKDQSKPKPRPCWQ